MRLRNLVVATCLTAAAFVPALLERLDAQGSTDIVISEFRFRGSSGVNDEFIELFNGGVAPVDVSGWLIRSSTNLSATAVTRLIIPAGTVIDRGCHYLVVNNSPGGYSGAAVGDRTYRNEFTDDGGVAVTRPDLSIVDQVGHGLIGAYGEGTRLPVQRSNADRGTQRRPSPTFGYIDTDDNAADFAEVAPADPQNSSSTCLVPTLVIYLPHDIQGPGATSPFAVGTAVIVRGVVTARKSDGFFLQTEAGLEDDNPDTSEAHFVSVSNGVPDEAQVGHLVQVQGSVAEFVPANERASAPRTELNRVTSVVDLGVSTTPVPARMTETDVSASGALDQLERFEGMRVMVPSLTAVTGTSGDKSEADATATSDGTFYAVITGEPRPFRRAGVARGYPVLPCQVDPCRIPIFDGNAGRLRVDSDALEGTAAVDVSSGAVMTDVVGVLDSGFRTYTLLPEVTLTPVGGRAVTPARAAGPDQFTIASFNMERFFDATVDSDTDFQLTPEAYETRLSKASLLIRTVLHNPDILGVQEVENLAVLEQLATRINADALAAGGAAPGYAALLFEGSDPASLDVGVLVKTAGDRVTVTSAEQVGAATTFVDPSDDSLHLLNEHPTVVLRAVIQGPAALLPQSVTVIVNHLQSLAEVGSDNGRGRRVRAQRRAQAEFLATYIQDRQLNDPSEAIVSIGDYNAFGFNDGYVDTVGTILGTPAPVDRVAAASADLVTPDLVDLADFMAASERYSSLENGNAQALEHVLVTANLVSQFARFVHPRVNADFPESLRGDAATPQRLTERDPAVAYFSFPPDLEAPVVSFAPGNQRVEATSAAGAIVTYAVPTATDNLDGDVAIACEPASGATLPLGNTEVTCTAADAAGNVASVSFLATVEDTTAPEVTAPDGISAEATSADGAVVTFTASATDAVTDSPVVTCAPASGSTFPVGVTTVQCSAADAAGNNGSVSFSATVADTIAPQVTVPDGISAEATSADGAVVTFTASATDAVTDSPVVTCAPASGSTFPVGVTTVQCSTSDAAGNNGSVSFSATVADTIAPQVTVPDGISTEATSADGAVVTFTASATDAVTTSPVVTCAPASGSTFPVGVTTVQCSTSDAAGNVASVSFSATVADTTAPVVTVPADVSAEATSADGGVVTFAASATDTVTTSPVVTCAPASGSTFPVGVTTVQCSASDAAGNVASVSFSATVADTTAPNVTVPAEVSAEATSAAGGVVTFAASATDSVTNSPVVTCAPASGTTFPLGDTEVTCTAADATGNVASVSFSATVEDTTAPVVTVPADITAIATSAAGRVVTFPASATDTVTNSPVVTCAPASGSTFPVGDTTVQCSASDNAGNPAGATFTVTIGALPAPAPSQPGHIHGAGTIGSVRARTAFALEVRESANHVDRGWLVVKVGSKYFAAGVSSAVFTNSPGFSSSTYPRSGNISVSFTGVGWWSGHPGHTFEATATDQGEPGRGRDTFTLVVRAPNGTVVASVTGTLTSGELRSRR